MVPQEKQRMQVIEQLSQHCGELQRAQEQRQQELLKELERRPWGAGKQHGCLPSESEARLAQVWPSEKIMGMASVVECEVEQCHPAV